MEVHEFFRAYANVPLLLRKKALMIKTRGYNMMYTLDTARDRIRYLERQPVQTEESAEEKALLIGAFEKYVKDNQA